MVFQAGKYFTFRELRQEQKFADITIAFKHYRYVVRRRRIGITQHRL